VTAGSFKGSACKASATVGRLGGPATASLEGVSLKLTYYAGAAAVGTYTLVASFKGSTDYAAAQSTAVTFTISQATPTVTVTDAGGTYNGKAFPATAKVVAVTGTAGPSLEKIAPTLTYYAGPSASGTPLAGAPTAVGTYTVVASFAGSTDYAAATSKPVTFKIKPVVKTSADKTSAAAVNDAALLEVVGQPASFQPGSFTTKGSGSQGSSQPETQARVRPLAPLAGASGFSRARNRLA
jgi:hypothetical protein